MRRRRTALSCRHQEVAEHAQPPRAAPVAHPAPPVGPHAIWCVTDNPSAVREALEALTHERTKLARHPTSERKRKALLGMTHDVSGKDTLDRFLQQSLVVHERWIPTESRPDASDELVIDERHAYFEAVCHRHHVEIAQQLDTEVLTALEPRDRRRRRFST